MQTKDQRMERFKNAGLYFVVTQEYSILPSYNVVDEFLKAGGKLFQLREKQLSNEEIIDLGLKLSELRDRYGAVFIMNDSPELAVAARADGVHLGQDDISVAKARKILGDDYIIGVSTHSIYEAEKAVSDGADYINIGPVFHTMTKEHMEIVPVNLIEKIVSRTNIPFTFMGGIKESNISQLLKFNPSALAMVTEISRSTDVSKKVKSLLNIIC